MSANLRVRGTAAAQSLVVAVLAARIASAQTPLPLGDPILVNSAATAGTQPTLDLGVADDGRLLVVWSNNEGLDSIFSRLFAANGAPFNQAELDQNTIGPSRAPSLAVNGSGDWVAGWGADLANNGDEIAAARRGTVNGSVLGNQFDLRSESGEVILARPQVATAEDDSFVAVWTRFSAQDDMVYRKFAANGTPTAAERFVNQVTPDTVVSFSVAAAPDGGFLVVWGRSLASDAAVFGRCFDADGDPLGDEFEVPSSGVGQQTRPVAGVDGQGGFLVGWIQATTASTFEFRRLAPDCTPLGTDQPLASGPAQALFDFDVAPDGGFVLAWTSSDLDVSGGVSVREFGKAFEPASDIFLAHPVTTGTQRQPKVGIGNEIFAVGWVSPDAPPQETDDDIYARRFRRRVIFGDDFESGDAGYWSAAVP